MFRGDAGNAKVGDSGLIAVSGGRPRESGGVFSIVGRVLPRSGVRNCSWGSRGCMRVYCSCSSLSSGGEVVRGGILLSRLRIWKWSMVVESSDSRVADCELNSVG